MPLQRLYIERFLLNLLPLQETTAQRTCRGRQRTGLVMRALKLPSHSSSVKARERMRGWRVAVPNLWHASSKRCSAKFPSAAGNRIRMQHAARWLAMSGAKNADIAADGGLTNRSHFNRFGRPSGKRRLNRTSFERMLQKELQREILTTLACRGRNAS